MNAVTRWLRDALGTTPGRYRLASVALALLLTATGVAFLIGATGLRSSADAIRESNGPVLVASQRLVASLSEADAAATAAYLAGGEGDREQLRLYDEALARSANQLEEMAALVGDEPRIHAVITDVSVNITRYAGLVEAARAHNRAAIPGGDRYLVDALTLLSGDINADVTRLSDSVEEGLDEEQDNLSGRLVVPITLAGVTVVALAVAQVLLTRRSRRLVNPALVLTLVLLGGAIIWLLTAASGSRNEIERARAGGYESIALTAEIQTTAYRAKAAEMAALITGEAGRARDADEARAALASSPLAEEVIDGIRAGEPINQSGLLLDAARGADSRRERAGVVEALLWWHRYVDTVNELRAASGPDAAAIAINQANPAFNGFNFTVESVLGDNQAQFLAGLEEASDSLRWVGLGIIVLPLVGAVSALTGFQARINEYW
ncbi:MAG: hypothetical protein ACRD29_02255 [Acidimicrobiales bacterium]